MQLRWNRDISRRGTKVGCYGCLRDGKVCDTCEASVLAILQAGETAAASWRAETSQSQLEAVVAESRAYCAQQANEFMADLHRRLAEEETLCKTRELAEDCARQTLSADKLNTDDSNSIPSTMAMLDTIDLGQDFMHMTYDVEDLFPSQYSFPEPVPPLTVGHLTMQDLAGPALAELLTQMDSDDETDTDTNTDTDTDTDEETDADSDGDETDTDTNTDTDTDTDEETDTDSDGDELVECDFCKKKDINPNDLDVTEVNLAEQAGGYAHKRCMPKIISNAASANVTARSRKRKRRMASC